MRKLLLLLLFLPSCGLDQGPRSEQLRAEGVVEEELEADFTLVGVEDLLTDRVVNVSVRRGTIFAVGVQSVGKEIDARGVFIAPGFIDSHVHLAYWQVGGQLPSHGVVGAVDLAAPIQVLDSSLSPLLVLWAGPMLTQMGGYPTRSWGAAGYGFECDGALAAVAAVDEILSAGAKVIKLAISGEPALSDEALRAATNRAHEYGVRVVAHALSEDSVLRASQAGVDVLAHTPTEALSDEGIASFSHGAVISTLTAFGAGEDSIGNLRTLRAAGTQVLYGTDLGNARVAGIHPGEIQALLKAGLSAKEIIESATRRPARFWGFSSLGEIRAGARASFLLYNEDPRVTPASLATPDEVYVEGVRMMTSEAN